MKLTISPTTRWLLFLLILGVAIALRFWRIDQIPPGFDFDEAHEGIEAWHILTDATYRPVYLTANDGIPPLNAYLNAITFGLFRWFGVEVGPTAMRVTAAVMGVFGVWALYALASEMHRMDLARAGPAGGGLSGAFPFFAAAVLAVMRWHVHFSRFGIEPILVPVLWAATFWLLLHGWRTGHWLSFAGGGVMAAAAIYAYQGAWLMPVLVAFTAGQLLLYQAAHKGWLPALPSARTVRARLWSRQGGGLLLLALVAVILLAPLGWYMWHHLDFILKRPGQLIANVDADVTDANALWRNLGRVATMFGPWGDSSDLNTRRNLPGTYALNIWLALPFYGGLALALWRWHRPQYALVLSGLVGLLLPGAVSLHQPHLHRLLGATAPTALLCGIALDWLWQWRPKLGGQPFDVQTVWARGRLRLAQIGQQAHWVALLLLVAGGTTATYEYFFRWATMGELYYKFNGPLWTMARQITAEPPDVPVYFTPIKQSHPVLTFAWETNQRPAPVVFDGHTVLPVNTGATQPEVYAVLDYTDAETGQRLAQLFSTLQVQQALADPEGHVYGRLYQRPANPPIQLTPHYSQTATLQDGITLVGYDLPETTVQPGDTLHLQLHWLVKATPTRDWKVFVRLLSTDAANKLHVSNTVNSRPGHGSLPTTRWQAGWQILDKYSLTVPEHQTPGDYGLEIGLFRAEQADFPKSKRGLLLGVIKVEKPR